MKNYRNVSTSGWVLAALLAAAAGTVSCKKTEAPTAGSVCLVTEQAGVPHAGADSGLLRRSLG